MNITRQAIYKIGAALLLTAYTLPVSALTYCNTSTINSTHPSSCDTEAPAY